jgi:hypothetical protein
VSLRPLSVLVLLALLALGGRPALSQNTVPGGGFGPPPAPTPGQSISIGAGNLGGGMGALPAPTPGQSSSTSAGNVGGGFGPLPQRTPGQSRGRRWRN